MGERELLAIAVLQERRDTILVLRGDVDIETAPRLWESVERVLPRSERVILDLRHVGFLDSSGLSVLVRAHRRLCHAGGMLVIRSPNAGVRRVLDLTGVGELLTVEG